MCSDEKMVTWRIGGVLVLLVALTTFAPVAAAAQDADRGTLQITPRLGGAVFLSDLADPVSSEEGNEITTKMENTFAYGLDLAVRLDERFTVETNALYVPSQLSARAEGVTVGVDANLYIAGGALLYKFPRPDSQITPFLAGGLGVKGYDGDFSPETDFMWNVGAGALVSLGQSLSARVDVRDYISSFGEGEEARLQNDVLVTLGILVVPF